MLYKYKKYFTAILLLITMLFTGSVVNVAVFNFSNIHIGVKSFTFYTNNNKFNLYKVNSFFNKKVHFAKSSIYPIYSVNFIQNLDTLKTPSDRKIRKNIFIKMLLPLIVKANASLQLEHNHILCIKQQWQKKHYITSKQEEHLRALASKYGVNYKKNFNSNINSIIKQLIIKVHPVNNSLVLAVAIQETGWGKSRFLKQGNSLFSQGGYATKHEKLLFGRKTTSKEYGIIAYDSLIDSITAFIFNINSAKLYHKLRLVRARSNNSYYMAKYLDGYAIMPNYAKSIQKIIRKYKLQQYDKYNTIMPNVKPVYVYFK